MRLTPRQHHYLHALGIEVYKVRETEDRRQSLMGTDLKSVSGRTPDTGVIDEGRSVRAGGVAVAARRRDFS